MSENADKFVKCSDRQPPKTGWYDVRAIIDGEPSFAQLKYDSDLGADSLAKVEIKTAFEEEFDVVILDEDVERIKTVGDCIAMAKHLLPLYERADPPAKCTSGKTTITIGNNPITGLATAAKVLSDNKPAVDNIDKAKEFLVNFMQSEFKDKTFSKYIREQLAGDFACELQRAITNLVWK